MSPVSAILGLLGSMLLDGVFLTAALPKLRNPRAFALIVVEYRVLPLRASLLYARLLPPLELLATLLLLAGITVRWAAALLAALLASFCVAIALNLVHGRKLDCGCFGTADKKPGRRVSPGLLAQDLALLGVAVCIFVAAPSGLALAPWSLARLAGSGQAITFVALAGCIVLAVTASLVLSHPQWRRYRPGAQRRVREAQGEPVTLVDRAGASRSPITSV